MAGFRQVTVPKEGGYEHDFHVFHFDSISNTLWFVGEKVNHYPLYTIHTEPPFQAKCVDSIAYYFPQGGMKMVSYVPGELTLMDPKSEEWEFREYKYLKNTWAFDRSSVYENQSKSRCFHSTHYDSVWVGTEEGLRLVLTRSKKVLELAKPLKNIIGIVPYGDHHLILGTKSQGLFIINKSRPNELVSIYPFGRHFSGEFPGDLLSMILDRDNNLWISTVASGILMTPLYRKQVSSFLQAPDPVSIKGIAEDGKGDLWLLSSRGIMKSSSDGKMLPLTNSLKKLNSSTFENSAFFISSDKEKNIWLGTFRGLFVKPVSQEEFFQVKTLDPSANSNLFFSSFTESTSGESLAFSYRNGVFPIIQKDGNFFLDNRHKVVESGTFMYAQAAPSGLILANLWPKGIIIFRPGAEGWKIYPDTLEYNSLVYGIIEDQESEKIWIGGQNGLSYIEQSKGDFNIRKDEIFSQSYPNANSLLLDKKNRLWVGTGNGLVLYTHSAQTWKLPETPGNHFFQLDQSFGMADNEFNPKAAFQSISGRSYWGSPKGLSSFDPLDLKLDVYPARPKISQVLINEKPIEVSTIQSTGQRLPEMDVYSSDRTVEITFISNEEYGDRNTISYKSLLKSSNGEVINIQDQNVARFVNMKPGSYTFQMYASNSLKRWEMPESLAIIVHPHWSATFWFRGLILVCFLLIVYTVYRNQLRLANNKQELAENRQRMAEFKVREVEIESAIKRLQINPHFIFNSLNSIRAYIMENNVDLADDFLMKFGVLMRKILEIAEKPYISLRNELEILEAYMKIEMLRFENSFSYEISYPESWDLDDILVPTMILQPFVENSIIHGFKDKSVHGIINLSFNLEGEYLISKVQDNGVGRDSGHNNPKYHQSKAIEITKQRLDLISIKTGKKTKFEILDHKNPSGTEVIITFPSDLS